MQVKTVLTHKDGPAGTVNHHYLTETFSPKCKVIGHFYRFNSHLIWSEYVKEPKK